MDFLRNMASMPLSDDTFDQCAASTCFHVRVAATTMTLFSLFTMVVVIGKALIGYSAQQVDACVNILLYMALLFALALAVAGLFFPKPNSGLIDQTEYWNTVKNVLEERRLNSRRHRPASLLHSDMQVHGPFHIVMHIMHLVSLGFTAVNFISIVVVEVLLLSKWNPIFTLGIFFGWILANFCWLAADLFCALTGGKKKLEAMIKKRKNLRQPFWRFYEDLILCVPKDILLEMDRILRPEGAVILHEEVDFVNKVRKIVGGMGWETITMDHEDGPLVPEKILHCITQYWVGSGKKTEHPLIK